MSDICARAGCGTAPVVYRGFCSVRCHELVDAIAQERARAVAIINPLLEWACLSNDPRLYPIIAAARDYCAEGEKP